MNIIPAFLSKTDAQVFNFDTYTQRAYVPYPNRVKPKTQTTSFAGTLKNFNELTRANFAIQSVRLYDCLPNDGTSQYGNWPHNYINLRIDYYNPANGVLAFTAEADEGILLYDVTFIVFGGIPR